MKKNISLFLIITILLLCYSFNAYGEILYKNDDVGIEFIVPDGWRKETLLQERQSIQSKYVNDNGDIILFGFNDIYNSLLEEDKKSIKRSDINSDNFTVNDIKEIFIATNIIKISAMEKEIINSLQYFKITGILLETQQETPVYNTDFISYLCIYDGIYYIFQFSGNEKSQSYNEFKNLLNSIKYDIDFTANANNLALDLPFNTSDSFTSIYFLLSLFYTIIVYSVPIAIYRYVILKHPLTKKKALAITIIWYIISVIVIVITSADHKTGAAATFWSIINYYILTKGKDKRKIFIENEEQTSLNDELTDNESDTVGNIYTISDVTYENPCNKAGTEILDTREQIITEKTNYSTDSNKEIEIQNEKIDDNLIEKTIEDEIMFCRKCGASITNDSIFCFRCGAKIRT